MGAVSSVIVEMSTVLTIGYGGRSIDQVTDCLRQFNVTHLVDVRSIPMSRFDPDFDRPTLDSKLASLGIKYIFMGDSLGGRPDDRSCYDHDGRVVYEKVRELPLFKKGIDKLLEAAGGQQRIICLLCSELKPEQCHRSKLIGVELASRGAIVDHILGPTRSAGQSEVMSRVDNGQPGLFNEPLTSRKSYAGPI